MNWDRIDRARAHARGLLWVAAFAIGTPAFLWVVAPNVTWGGSNRTETVGPSMVDLLTVIGIGGVIFGLAWMWRIYKAPTKHEGAHWRFRDH
jgi:hypothetical protein